MAPAGRCKTCHSEGLGPRHRAHSGRRHERPDPRARQEPGGPLPALQPPEGRRWIEDAGASPERGAGVAAKSWAPLSKGRRRAGRPGQNCPCSTVPPRRRAHIRSARSRTGPDTPGWRGCRAPPVSPRSTGRRRALQTYSPWLGSAESLPDPIRTVLNVPASGVIVPEIIVIAPVEYAIHVRTSAHDI